MHKDEQEHAGYHRLMILKPWLCPLWSVVVCVIVQWWSSLASVSMKQCENASSHQTNNSDKMTNTHCMKPNILCIVYYMCIKSV